MRAFLVALIAGLTLASSAGCGLVATKSGAPSASSPAKPSSKPAGPAYLAKPKVGECHDLTIKDIRAVSETKKPVACSKRHNTVTVAVVEEPTGEAKGDDRTLAVGQACGPGFIETVGGDSKTRAKTLYSLAWFTPTKAQKAKGAKWMRCDVTLTALNRALPLDNEKPLLKGGATKDELACGRLADGEKLAWVFVPCSDDHQFVLEDMIEAPDGTSYKQARAAAKKACALKGGLYSWSHADQWGIGDRWYICWKPNGPINRDPGVLASGPLTAR